MKGKGLCIIRGTGQQEAQGRCVEFHDNFLVFDEKKGSKEER